ncbi:citramalyl-CoA lyase, mitochondrial-like [Schistocerca gregaria]|uniref:citramalyl-CoA lyase, mitochondrial-like n=1 Tax=Schistocerca gregaria TaxID=7010 RepID=UPI00211DE9AB|nr:citramalyl-CoA lyase, mitochondrial-like [Schistocerca gregaria]
MLSQQLIRTQPSCSPRTFRCPSACRSLSHSASSRRPRRVLFNVPGSDERKIHKALSLDLDVIVLDLEDGVSPNKKHEARSLVGQKLKSCHFGRSERCVRINSSNSGLEFEDLKSLLPFLEYIDSILIPKVETAEDLLFVDDLLLQNNNTRTKLFAAIESPRALLNLRPICNATPRLDCLIFGSEDYVANAGMTRSSGLEELAYARSKIVTYASAHSLYSTDLVCIDYKNIEQLKKESISGFTLGFDGKQAIHPGQVDTIYQCFQPPIETVEFAKKIVSEYRAHSSAGKGAFVINDKMIDLPMVKWALKVLSKASVPVEQLPSV